MVDSTLNIHDLPKILLVSEDPQLLTNCLQKRGCLTNNVWSFNTKYYDANVSLVHYTSGQEYTKVEAIIFLVRHTPDLLLMSS